MMNFSLKGAPDHSQIKSYAKQKQQFWWLTKIIHELLSLNQLT